MSKVLPASRSSQLSRRRFLGKGLRWLLFVTGLAAMTGGYSVFIERFRFTFREVEIRIPRLPAAFDGLRIAHLSDLHLGYHLEIGDLSHVFDRVAEWQPDLICFTGDLVDLSTDPLESALPVLARLQAPLGKYAVLGNHDYRSAEAKITDCLQQAGFHVLVNQNKLLERDGQTLCVAGVDDILHGQPDLQAALTGIDPAICKLLLAHEPDYADDIPDGLIDLQMSGHSHGGQVRLPFAGALLLPPYGKKYPDGLQRRSGGTQLVYTTRGIGTTVLPIRFLCRPEVGLLTLRQQT
ncbi:metallophosphoesterase [Brevibacillus fluminis]|uniref:Metallophosphoesterase n=1 Tax=Brevibacillus fluminis TaxID=511487 RepID=A0A3M8D077_9BACL|nr:metallophosphoesterase [Brevibacillus fluminis]